MDAEDFKVRFPEFAKTPEPVLASTLSEAATQIQDEGRFGDLYDSAHGLLAAHALAMSPQGRQAKLDAANGMTIYRRRYLEICKRAVGVAGFPV